MRETLGSPFKLQLYGGSLYQLILKKIEEK